MGDRDRRGGGPIDQADGVGDPGAIGHRPHLVVDEGAVHEGGGITDDRDPLVDEDRDPEVLLVGASLAVEHRPGVAGHEQALMPGQRGPQVVEEVGPLRQRPLAVVEVGPSVKSRGSGDLLQAEHIGPAARQPLHQRREHGPTPGVQRDDPHRSGPANDTPVRRGHTVGAHRSTAHRRASGPAGSGSWTASAKRAGSEPALV
jgi:hypothetical protein